MAAVTGHVITPRPWRTTEEGWSLFQASSTPAEFGTIEEDKWAM